MWINPQTVVVLLIAALAAVITGLITAKITRHPPMWSLVAALVVVSVGQALIQNHPEVLSSVPNALDRSTTATTSAPTPVVSRSTAAVSSMPPSPKTSPSKTPLRMSSRPTAVVVTSRPSATPRRTVIRTQAKDFVVVPVLPSGATADVTKSFQVLMRLEGANPYATIQWTYSVNLQGNSSTPACPAYTKGCGIPLANGSLHADSAGNATFSLQYDPAPVLAAMKKYGVGPPYDVTIGWRTFDFYCATCQANQNTINWFFNG